MYPKDPDEPSVSDSSSDSSSDASDAESEHSHQSAQFSESDPESLEPDQLNAVVAELSQQIEANPYLYDAHVRRIKLLRQSMQLEKLREARECMSKYFPITPKIWLRLINAEKELLKSENKNPKETIYALFKRALADYQSVPLWMEWCQNAIGLSYVAGEVQETRDIFEAALAAQGLNFAKGTLLFEVYRELENLHLARLAEAAGDSVESPEVAEQLKRIDSLFRRQLSVPDADLDMTLSEYTAFLTNHAAVLGHDSPSEACLAAHRSAQAKWCAVEQFEEAVASKPHGDEAQLFAAWEPYLAWAVEQASRRGTKANVTAEAAPVTLTPPEVLCLFERAIADCCLQLPVWLKAADYLEAHVAADRERLVATLARAVRNIQWSSELWCRYAAVCEARAWEQAANGSAETSGESNAAGDSVSYVLSRELDPVMEIFEEAVKYSYPSGPELTAVWTAYCDFLLRVHQHSNDAALKERSCQMLRNAFKRGQKHITSAFPDPAHHDFSLYTYWAFVEARYLGNRGAANDLWKEMLKVGRNGNNAAFWISYLAFLKEHDEPETLVRVAAMAVNSVTGEHAESVFASARRCLAERAVDIRRLREFDLKVTQRRARLAAMGAGAGGKSEAKQTTKQGKRKAEEHQTTPIQTPQKRQKVEEDQAQPSEGKVQQQKAKAMGPGKWAKENEGEAAESRPKHGETVTHDPSKDDRTVFVSNLPFATTEDDLKAIFTKCGQVTSVRLARDYAGKSKGFGYVEFAAPAEAASALEMDRFPIDTGGRSGVGGLGGRPMFVSVCDTSRSKAAGFHYAVGVPEPNKLFVKNLDKTVTQEALKVFFSKHGEVKSVRLVTFRNGAPKGHAYVEFADEDAASRALVATDGVMIGSKPIQVAISNPPPRPAPGSTNQRGPAAAAAAAHPPAPKPTRTKAQSQLAFMPRAIHRTAGGGGGGGGGGSNACVEKQPPPAPSQPQAASLLSDQNSVSTAVPKSNEDFRRMFLK